MTLRKASALLTIIILFVLALLVLPMQIRLNLAHMVMSSLLLVLLSVIVWSTFTIPEPMEAMVEIRGRTYCFPDIPDNFSLILENDPPELQVGDCDKDIFMLHFSLKTKSPPHFKVVFHSSIGTVLFEEPNLRIGKTISIPSNFLTAARIKANDLPVNIQIREG